MKLKDAPIQRKLINVILLTCAVVLLIMCSFYMVFEFFTFRNIVKTNVMSLAAVVASNSTAALAFDSQKDAEEMLNALKAEKHIVAASLYDLQGNLFAQYPRNLDKHHFPARPAKEGYWFEGAYLVGFEPIVQEKNKLGILYIRSDLKTMYEQLRRYGVVALSLICASLVIAYFLSRLLQKTISSPILALQKTAKIVSENGDYSLRAVKSGEDEIGALTDAFNNMLARIESQNLQITSFNQHLEQKIKKRTIELEDANTTLKQQKEFVETIINSSVDLVAVFDKDLNYVMLNKRAGEYYHANKDDIIGKNILEVFPQVSDSGMLADLRKALSGEIVHVSTYKSPILDRYFENFYIPLTDDDNNVYGALNIGHDITKMIESNEKLQLVNAELKKSNRDLEQFAYVASHDLQEPLRKIQTFTQLMGENLNNEPQLKIYHQKINQSASRMQQLIQDVLNFSRISNSGDAFVPVDLNQVIEHLKADYELLLQEKNAIIIHSYLPVIQGIPLQLSQLFSNLISNSLKYSAKNPVITISVLSLSKEKMNEYARPNDSLSYLLIKFNDNCIGFDAQYSEKIFTIFQRLHNKQTYSGTGIALLFVGKL